MDWSVDNGLIHGLDWAGLQNFNISRIWIGLDYDFPDWIGPDPEKFIHSLL